MSRGGFRHVYGPVPSRRLGRSLGVALVPFKTCSYDCIYCQLGRTTNKTTEFDEYVPVEGVLAELHEKLRGEPGPDFIGLAGSGEPTLHSRIAELIAGLKRSTSVPVAVLTNGSLLFRPEVRAALAEADLVMPSLDAGSQSSFERVNRPHADISFERMVDGLLTFSHEFKGKIWLEVFILAGITDQRDEVGRIAAIVDKMQLDRVQLNTVSRPPADASALTVSVDDLEKLRGLFSCPCEVIAESRPSQQVRSSGSKNAEEQIVALVSRRPCTVEGIATGLGLRPNEVLKRLEVLCATGTIRAERRGEAVFYEGVRNR
jgi:wyosine [tRNA(Phe)-imidazoG37] synthetase (radical SAM superfamily)